MFAAVIRLSILGLATASIAGCGGGSSVVDTNENGPTAVTIQFTGSTPTAVATKIGSGSFTAATITSGQLTLSLPAGTSDFAVAFVCPAVSPTATANPQQFVFEASTLDGTLFAESCLELPTASQAGTLTGSVDASAIPGTAFLQIDAGGFGLLGAGYMPGPVSSFAFPALAGIDRVEVLAYSGSQLLTTPGSGFSLVAAKSFDNQTVPGALNGASTVVFGPADETTQQAVTLSNLPAGYMAPSTLASLTMSSGSGFLLANPVTTQYPALPAGAIESGDRYRISSTAVNAANSSEAVEVTRTLAAAAPVAIAFPAPWSYAGPTPAALPVFGFAYSGFSSATDVFYEAEMEWPWAIPENPFLFKMAATGNYLNGTMTLAFPDLSGVTGFLAPPASGTVVLWNANVTAEGPDPWQQASTANATETTVLNAGTYTVP